jgi:PAS domain S-box-containing protein
MKDYFWINDMSPRMIVHPYRPDLEGRDLSTMTDPHGTPLFLEFVKTVREQGEGYVEYMWQWQDDPSRVVPKLSFVRGFEPWGWIIGTGVYLEDVRQEIGRVSRHLATVSLLILTAVSALLLFIVTQSLGTERRRIQAEDALRRSEERYRGLVESASETLIMAVEGEGLFANANATRQLGYSAEELRHKRLEDLVESDTEQGETESLFASLTTGDDSTPVRLETALVARDGTRMPAVLSCSQVRMGERRGLAVVATDMTEHSLREGRRDRNESRLQQRLALLEELEAEHRESLEKVRTALILLDQPTDTSAPIRLLEAIRAASDIEEVVRLNARIPDLTTVLVQSGYRAENINRLITVNTDVVVAKLIDTATERLGPPPCEFAFLIMGSEGRREQTLCTDQDNAILLADDHGDGTGAYFSDLADLVCDWLDQAGYARCTGGMMASNPEWRRTLSDWNTTFRRWIRGQEPEDLLRSKVLFDFRCAYGSRPLAERLREDLNQGLAAEERFLGQLAQDVLRVTPPLGVFGTIQLSRTDDGRKALDLKGAMAPITDFARIYALRHGLDLTNTLERLDALARIGAIPRQTAEEAMQTYSPLMQIRIEHQVAALVAGRRPDNLVEPGELSLMEKRVLKESFHQIRDLQTRLSYDFIGLPGRPG